ncbi:hypothetical protein, partial [Paenibacillus sp. IHBB 10380]|uniref:hypothetical protein n=2 Tax=Paenibacillus TaxID=44249 RepID=UPI001C92BCC7
PSQPSQQPETIFENRLFQEQLTSHHRGGRTAIVLFHHKKNGGAGTSSLCTAASYHASFNSSVPSR